LPLLIDALIWLDFASCGIWMSCGASFMLQHLTSWAGATLASEPPTLAEQFGSHWRTARSDHGHHVAYIFLICARLVVVN
jgi:hypothetical protein